MKILLLLSIALIGFASSYAQTPAKPDAPDSESRETAKLSEEVVRLFQAGKYDEALPLAKQAIEAREKELGPNHILVAQAWRNLAYVELNVKKEKEASKAFDKAFDIYEKNQPLLPSDEKMFAEMLEAVAIYDAVDGQLDKAVKRMLRAVEISERLNGANSEKTASPLLHLAEIYEAKGDYEKAEPILTRVLQVKTQRTGKIGSDPEHIYDSLSCTLTKLGRDAEVKELDAKYYPEDTNKPKDDAKIVRGGVVNGKALFLLKPPYPAAAREVRAKGTVNVRVLIDEGGKVIFACAINGAKELQRASEIAAYGSKFSPTLLSGEPVKVNGIITYNFIP
jgi:tetratricopeptide (TPR) repeat protein